MFDRKIFSSRLKILRKEKGISMEKLAKAINLKSKASISQFESGENLPSFDTLLAIAKFFNVSTDYLLGLSDIQRPIPQNIQQILKQAADPAELLQALNKIYLENAGLSRNKIDALISGLDEESIRELRKYIAFLHSRQTLDNGEDESSAGLDSSIKNEGIR